MSTSIRRAGDCGIREYFEEGRISSNESRMAEEWEFGGDLAKAARCEAKTRRGMPCQCPAMSNVVVGFMVG
jgi:hypothetical protein